MARGLENTVQYYAGKEGQKHEIIIPQNRGPNKAKRYASIFYQLASRSK